jgi:hypothetical protein
MTADLEAITPALNAGLDVAETDKYKSDIRAPCRTGSCPFAIRLILIAFFVTVSEDDEVAPPYLATTDDRPLPEHPSRGTWRLLFQSSEGIDRLFGKRSMRRMLARDGWVISSAPLRTILHSRQKLG